MKFVPLTWEEMGRKAAHIAAFWPALFLPWVSPLAALGATLSLVLMNLFVLPFAAKGLYRSGVPGRGALEIVLYPAGLMATVVAFGLIPSDNFTNGSVVGKPAWYLPVGAAWFALACLDALIGIACRMLPSGPMLPWNSKKPIVAVLLATLVSLIPFAILATITLPSLTGYDWLILALLVFAAAMAETVWFGIADNLIIPFTISVLLVLVPNPLVASSDLFLESFKGLDWAWALAPFGFGLVAYFGSMLTLGGSALGACLSLLLVLANPMLFLFLCGFFAFGNLATRFKFYRKQSLGISEPRRGKRGAAEVFGAMGIAAWMTPLVHLAQRENGSLTNGPLSSALLVCIAPLIAKTMDTVSSEIGKAIGGKTISLRTLRLVAPGSEGGISLEGTMFGLGAAVILAAAIIPLGSGSWLEVLVLILIALVANIFESFWGEFAKKKGMDQGPHTNVLMTLVAAVVAWLIWFGIPGLL